MVSISQRRTPLPWHLALVALVALFVARAAGQHAPLEPEANLSLAYARSLAEGHGLVLHPHAERIEGPQSLLWTLMLAAAHSVGLHGTSATTTLALACAALALVLTALVPSALHDRKPRYFDLAAPAIASSITSFVSAGSNGLDHGLLAAITAATILALAYEERDAERYPWSAFVLVLLFLARPSALFAAMVVGACKLVRNATPSKPRRQDVLWVVSLAAGLFAIALFRLAYFAAVLPSATLAHDWTLRSLVDGRRHALALCWQWLRDERLGALAALSFASLFGSKPLSARVAVIGLALSSSLCASAIDRSAAAPSLSFATAALMLSLAGAEGARNITLLLARLTPRVARAALAWIATPACVAALLVLGPSRAIAPRQAPQRQRSTVAASEIARHARALALSEPVTVAACAESLSLDDDSVRIRDLSGRAAATFARSKFRDDHALFEGSSPNFVVIDGRCHASDWLRASPTRRSMYIELTAATRPSVRVFVDRESIAAPFAVGAERRAASTGLAGVTLSHERAAPGATVAAELLLTAESARAPSFVRLVDELGALVAQQPCAPSSLGTDWVLAGERPRVRVVFRAPNAGRFRIEWRRDGHPDVVLGALEVQRGAEDRDNLERVARVRRALTDERHDLAWSAARSLALRSSVEPTSQSARDALAEFARALAERAKIAADARAWTIAADIAESAQRVAPEDRRTLSLCAEVAERLADAASEAGSSNRFDAAFLLAERAVQIDPRRSWSRRRAESLRALAGRSSPVADRVAAYRAAVDAVAAADSSALDRAIVQLATARAWLEAARLAEHTGHTPRDPAARLAVAHGLLSQGRAREALALVSGVPCAEASDREVTRALRAIMGARAYRPFDSACRED